MDTTIEKIMHFLQGEMQTPNLYGWFHILSLAIVIITCLLIFTFRKRISQRVVNNIVLITGIVVIIFEVYKQLIFSFNYVGGGASTWSYQWYAFPFQFCSTPMYLMLLAGIIRKGRVHDNLLCYLATFAVFAGLCVMLYPGDVFMKYIGINIQTMVCHGSMIIIGCLIFATKSIEINLKSILKAFEVFVIVCAIALGANIIWHYCGTTETFNMFYISPYYDCTLPLLSMIYPKVHYAIFLAIYLVGFTLAATVIMLIAMLCNHLTSKIAKKNAN